MNAIIYGLLAETSIHVGSGQSTGFVDLPFHREAATDYPVIAGSSVKGALRDLARQRMGEDDGNLANVFGKQEHAGTLVISDARLLLLPVRSMTSSYRWLTCPHLIERALRDYQRAYNRSKNLDLGQVIAIEKNQYLGRGDGSLYLEERQFEAAKEPLPDPLYAFLASFIPHPHTHDRLRNHVAVLHDDDFVWFARHGLAITARNNLHKEHKTSLNLWYEETLPPDSLLYVLLLERQSGGLSLVSQLFEQAPYMQIGGNETVGQGWFAVHCAHASTSAPGESA